MPEVSFNEQGISVLVGLLALNEDEGGYGEIAAEDLGTVRQKILKVKNMFSARKPFLSEDRVEGNWFDFGNDDARTLSRLDRFDSFLAFAQQHNVGVYWA